ncbi:MAG TPA: hypothetical protein VFE98_09880 [Candidatus Bathyarchaeia archaeon]|nr:hypothetical protein [Candidatus Bathyarchaeia archaeon]
METKLIRDTIKKRARRFINADPKKRPNILIQILGRRPPQQGHVFLVRNGSRSIRIDTFNSITELSLIVETICQEYLKVKG